jgi:hypothetical protein
MVYLTVNSPNSMQTTRHLAKRYPINGRVTELLSIGLESHPLHSFPFAGLVRRLTNIFLIQCTRRAHAMHTPLVKMLYRCTVALFLDFAASRLSDSWALQNFRRQTLSLCPQVPFLLVTFSVLCVFFPYSLRVLSIFFACYFFLLSCSFRISNKWPHRHRRGLFLPLREDSSRQFASTAPRPRRQFFEVVRSYLHDPWPSQPTVSFKDSVSFSHNFFQQIFKSILPPTP